MAIPDNDPVIGEPVIGEPVPKVDWVKTLSFRDGDVLLVHVRSRLDEAEGNSIRDNLQKVLDKTGAKNTQVVVFGGEMDINLTVLTPDQAYENHQKYCKLGCDQFPDPGCSLGCTLYSKKSNPL
jgi:hypothetical protein